MKVAVIHNAYGRISGEEVVIEDLVQVLESKGHVVSRFTRSSAEIMGCFSGTAKAFVTGIYNPVSRSKFRDFLHTSQPDMVHVHNVFPLISPSVLLECSAQHVPVVMTVHNYRQVCPSGLLLSHGEICHRCLGGKEYHCVLRNCENNRIKSVGYALRTAIARRSGFFLDHVDHFICLSDFQKSILVQSGFPANRMTVIPNPRLGKQAFVSASAGHYVAYVGRVSPEKDLSTLLEAARRLPAIPFKAAGSRDRMPDLVEQAPPNVEFIGHLDAEDLTAFYRDARMVVFATRCYEGFPSVLIEAMEYAKPIICSNIGGLPEIVRDEETGLLYEPQQPDDLSRKIELLWDDPVHCLALGTAGQQWQAERYGAERLYTKIQQVYEQAKMHAQQKTV